ncbi:5853_t:CDS:2, partial [Funneliformis geosporum]
ESDSNESKLRTVNYDSKLGGLEIGNIDNLNQKSVQLNSFIEDLIICIIKKHNEENPKGQNDIGYCYVNSIGVENDDKKAFKWYFKSAKNEYTEGQYNLVIVIDLNPQIGSNVSKSYSPIPTIITKGNLKPKLENSVFTSLIETVCGIIELFARFLPLITKVTLMFKEIIKFIKRLNIIKKYV